MAVGSQSRQASTLPATISPPPAQPPVKIESSRVPEKKVESIRSPSVSESSESESEGCATRFKNRQLSTQQVKRLDEVGTAFSLVRAKKGGELYLHDVLKYKEDLSRIVAAITTELDN